MTAEATLTQEALDEVRAYLRDHPHTGSQELAQILGLSLELAVFAKFHLVMATGGTD
jgi:hypothetical protein